VIISRTPFRVSFFGGGTDFPEFYLKHGGTTLLTTINHYCYISLHRISKFFQFRFRASYAKTELVQTPSEFQHPLIRESLLALDVQNNVEISHVSDLPGRTGLGSSSSFTVGLLHALHALQGDRVTPEDLAREAIHVERERINDAGGHQDQYAAAYGGLIRLEFRTDGRVDVHRIPITHKREDDFEQHLLMFYMGTESSAEEILSNQRKRTEKNLSALTEMCELVNEAERVIVSNDSVLTFGELLHHGWELKKSLSTGITNSSIDEAYNAARKEGALGGKLLGAGGRGFLLLFAEPEYHAGIREKLSVFQEVNFNLSQEGSRIIFDASE